MNPSDQQVAPPTDWQKFERMMTDLFEAEWGSRAYLHGRTGQSQAGVDIYGKPDDKGRHHGLQCKRRDAYAQQTVTLDEQEAEAEKALSFKPGLYQFSLLVTGQRDVKLQEAARELDKASRAKRSFGIDVLFWDDILLIYDRHMDVYNRHHDGHGLPRPRPNNLPFPRNPYFTGREGLLDQLSAQLTSAQFPAGVISQPQTVSGLGGVGKTQLAVEYAWANIARYDALLWAVADSPASLSANLAALAAADVLDLPERDAPDQSAAVAAVIARLKQDHRCLLILDSVDSPDAAGAVCEVLCPPLPGHVIITTRRQTGWPATVAPLSVDVLPVPAAADFLCARVTGHDPGPRSDAEALAEDLGGLPLALEQAGAYIVRNRITFAEYRRRLDKQRSKLLAEGVPGGTGYVRSVAETWLVTEEQLSLPARGLLRLMAFFAPDAMPRAMLAKAGPILNDLPRAKPTTSGTKAKAGKRKTPPPDADAALAELHEYSLAGLTPESASCHRLLQAVLLDRMSDEQRRDAALAALRLVDDFAAAEPGDVRSWPIWTPLAPHVQAAVKLADECGIAEPTARLMNELALYYFARAQHARAEPLMRRALEINEKSFGPEHPAVAVRLSNLAQLLDATNRLAEAEPLMRRALEIDEKSFGPEHPNVTTALNNLAQLLQATNRLSEAESLMRRALEIDEKSFGPEHPHVAGDLNNLAQLLQATNRLAEAEPLMRRALAIDEKSFGPEHPDVAIDLNNLAGLLQATNRLAEAEPLMRRALAIDEKSFGPEHPRVAVQLNNLAQLLDATNRLAEAEPLMRRVVEIAEKSFGPEHPDVAIDLNNLAALLQATNRLAEAEPLMRRALAIDEKSFGPEHPDVAIRLNNLAQLLQDTNRLAEAEPLMRRALEMDEKSFSPEHPNVAIRLNNLAGLLQATNRPAEAEPLMRRALAMDEKSFGPEHPDVARDLNNLALLLVATNRLAEAEPLLRRAVVILAKLRQATGHEYPNMGTAKGNYFGLLTKMGLDGAEAHRRVNQATGGQMPG